MSMTETLNDLPRDTRVLMEIGDAMAELVATAAVYPMLDGSGPNKVAGIVGKRAIGRARRDAAHRDGTLTWADQLGATWLEVLAAADAAALRDWLLKLSGSAALWASDLDRRHADSPAYLAARVDRLHPTTTAEEGS